MKLRPGQALTLARQMGPGWIAFRIGYALRRKLGLLERRMPLRSWEHYRLENPEGWLERLRRTPFFFEPGKPPVTGARLPQAEIPDWHRHALTGEVWPAVHWTRLSDHGASDVKVLWEPGRFAAAYELVRAGKPEAAESFWRLVESWREANPPNRGVHWMCGQECAIRTLAWCFALFGFAAAPATTADRTAMLIGMLAAHGERIEANLGYALAQKNNHGVNEALALWTLGLLFPDLPAAARWERLGRHHLESEGRRQLYSDGAYVQHSANYHRFVLQSYSWAFRLGEVTGRPLSEGLRDLLARSAGLLYQLTAETNGKAPNYGSNDGAQLFRLDGCTFEDYRPALVLACAVFQQRRPFPPGPWDEPLRWLGAEAAAEPIPRTSWSAADGGYYTLRSGDSWAFTRCCTYRDRPGQADLLHLDLWWRGCNVLADPGTYSYNSPPPWRNGLAGTRVHNAPAVDGLDQMERGPGFTWFGWTQGEIVRRETSPDGRLQLLAGRHTGYRKRLGVIHQRTIVAVDGRWWLVIDDLLGSGEHGASWQWLFPEALGPARTEGDFTTLKLPPGPVYLAFESSVPGGLTSLSGPADDTLGWFSPDYLVKKPAQALLRTAFGPLPLRHWTLIALGRAPRFTERTGGRLQVTDERVRLTVELAGGIDARLDAP